MPHINISPRIIRETSAGLTFTTVYDEMLARREIAIVGEIADAMAFEVCQHLFTLERQDPCAEIALHISSVGGSVGAGLAIVDAMCAVSCPVRTVCLNLAASMAAVIFVAGDRREMGEHAELMIHDPLIMGGAGGTALAVQATSKRLMGMRRTLNGLLAERSGLTLKRVQALTSKDTYLTAERACELGFADAVIESRKEAPRA